MTKKILKISKYRPSLFQSKLDFSVAGGNVSFSIEHPLEQTLFRALGLVLFVLLCGYFYFVSASVLNIIARKEADSKSASLQTSIAGMEQQYFALKDGMDTHTAAALGLSQIKDTQYVYVPGNAASAGTVAESII